MPERTTVRRGDVVIVDFGTDDSSRLNKTRPAVVVQSDRGNRNAEHTIVVPASRGEGSYPFHVELPTGDTGLNDRCHTRCSHATTVCLSVDVSHVVGHVPERKMDDIEAALQMTLGMD